jgi:hypothetical protein
LKGHRERLDDGEGFSRLRLIERLHRAADIANAAAGPPPEGEAACVLG